MKTRRMDPRIRRPMPQLVATNCQDGRSTLDFYRPHKKHGEGDVLIFMHGLSLVTTYPLHTHKAGTEYKKITCTPRGGIIGKKKKRSSCEIEDFVETHLASCVILRSHIFTACVSSLTPLEPPNPSLY